MRRWIGPAIAEFLAVFLLAVSAQVAVGDEGSSPTVEIPYLREVSVELPAEWIASECPQGKLPDRFEVRCEGSRVTFVAMEYSPDLGAQDVVIASTTANGAVRTMTYVVTLEPPRLTGPTSHTYGYPAGRGSMVTIPFAELRYDCGACSTTGPAYVDPTVSPAEAGTVRFSGLGLEFMPTPEYVGDVVMSFRLRDAFGQEAKTTELTLTVVQGASVAPIAVPDVARGEMDRPVSGNVLDNDTEVAEVSAILANCGRPSNGTVTCLPDGSFTYQPNAGFTGIDQFAYHAITQSTGDQGVGSVSVGIGVDPDPVLRQEPGGEVVPLFAPGSRDASSVAPGALVLLRDVVAQIPRATEE